MSQSGLAQSPRYPVGWVDATGATLPANQWYHTNKDGKDGTATTQLDTLPISNRPADKACVGGNRVFYPCGELILLSYSHSHFFRYILSL